MGRGLSAAYRSRGDQRSSLARSWWPSADGVDWAGDQAYIPPISLPTTRGVPLMQQRRHLGHSSSAGFPMTRSPSPPMRRTPFTTMAGASPCSGMAEIDRGTSMPWSRGYAPRARAFRPPGSEPRGAGAPRSPRRSAHRLAPVGPRIYGQTHPGGCARWHLVREWRVSSARPARVAALSPCLASGAPTRGRPMRRRGQPCRSSTTSTRSSSSALDLLIGQARESTIPPRRARLCGPSDTAWHWST